MNGFEKVNFRGTFRDYQKRVLDNADKYIKDGRINIVAAPGSGKTVLGLELIVRLKNPCIVLSPTTAIRQQWGERFKELFVSEDDFEELFSNDLHDVKMINSITYQGLYTAIESVSESEDDEPDCSDVDIFDTMRTFGIKTICLDEAHHLKNEWQKALEKFISHLDKDVKIISLTATPPYDSESAEWERYMGICGPIDEEIFVPELVGKKNLCPHQDYVYFNYPTEEEIQGFELHKKRAACAVEEIGKLELIEKVCRIINNENDYGVLFSSAKQYISLLTLLKFYERQLNRKVIKELTCKKGLPDFDMNHAEVAIQFLLDSDMLTEEEKEEIVEVLKNNSVYEKRKVTLELNEKLKRTLVSSVGKLDSIKQIAKSEINVMNDRLRMLVLTDYIRKENVEKIGTDEEFNSINVVSIFETLRRDNFNVNIGALSGSLVILPKSIDLSDINHRKEEIPNTDYCVVEFAGAIHRAIDYVGKLFKDGKINILVGTKSLLGEGWDSPCINSLILASFVGSFVLSNQMRGRAIRIDKNDPEKVANIWHLVAVEPDYLFEESKISEAMSRAKHNENELVSCDYDVLKRRFISFMGPNYSTGKIESGIERITAIKPPFDKEGIARINSEMLSASENRKLVKEKWDGEVVDGKMTVGVETEVPAEKKVPIITFESLVKNVALIVAMVALLVLLGYFAIIKKTFFAVAVLVVSLFVAVPLYKGIKKYFVHSKPVSSVKALGTAVYKTLRECGLLSSSANVKTSLGDDMKSVSLYLCDASVHDQNVFNTAMNELLSPIDNPRYVLIAKKGEGKYNYKLSFACPSVIGKKKEFVEVLAKKLKSSTGDFDVVYTHKEEGRALILKCRANSYITANEKALGKKYKVSHWE